ncbi:VOC family protein [bacterium]|nr:VOC family protein [bacterium]
MNITDGLIVFLGTDDLEATHTFYHDVLGLELDRDQGVCRIYRVPGGGCLGFCTHVPVARDARSPIITLLVEDVARSHETLLKRGATPEAPPAYNEKYRIEHFFLSDPNGYAVEIQRFVARES